MLWLLNAEESSNRETISEDLSCIFLLIFNAFLFELCKFHKNQIIKNIENIIFPTTTPKLKIAL